MNDKDKLVINGVLYREIEKSKAWGRAIMARAKVNNEFSRYKTRPPTKEQYEYRMKHKQFLQINRASARAWRVYRLSLIKAWENLNGKDYEIWLASFPYKEYN